MNQNQHVLYPTCSLVYLRQFPLNVQAIRVKIKLTIKYSEHDNNLNTVKEVSNTLAPKLKPAREN